MENLVWKSVEVFLSETLREQTIGIREIAEGLWEVRFSHLILGLSMKRP